jgi:hypothetical protein
MTRVPRFGPEEIALRHRIDRLSLLVSTARGQAKPDRLATTVIKVTYPSILDGLNAMDRARAMAKRWRGEMTEHALRENEANARLLSLHADVCGDILRRAIGATA